MSTTTQSMKWVSALSTKPSLEAAVREVVEQVKTALPAPPDLGLVFISAAFASEYARLLPLLQEMLPLPCLIGCSGGGVIGTLPQGEACEIEQKPALSLSVATLPGVEVQSFYLTEDDLPDLDSPPHAWVEKIGVPPAAQPCFILMADPFTSSINELLQGLDFAYPGAVKVGSLASVSSLQRSSGLFFDGTLHDEGVVGVALSGNIVLDAIVAQGCRPIGQTFRVVAGERNILLELEDSNDFGGATQTPLEALQAILKELSQSDRELAQHSLQIGIAQDGFKENLHHGDFLIRNLLGVDPRIGAIAIGDRIRAGQRIQFHLRDARTSADDLEALLTRYQRQMQSDPQVAPMGALMFSCMGRGEGLYQQPNFDSHLFNQYVGRVPLSGFFCGGEIGPIGGTTFLHGYTSVFGICRPAV
ncbi:MAG TPA: FIST N-terminal domain-containing protein [Candidatus Obscuribacterales bacterium]